MEADTAHMSSTGTPPKSVTKAEKRRASILESAELYFARRGYNATRLEDVAEDAGLTRPALFYHFADKQTLYQATLANAFGSLAQRLEIALMCSGSIAQRIENAMEVLIDEIVKRPSLGRLLMRYVADEDDQPADTIYPESNHLIRTAWTLFNQGRASGELNPLHDNPFHTASTVIGSTVFYVSAITKLIPTESFNPLSSEHIAAHKRETLQIVRLLLGITHAIDLPDDTAPDNATN